MGKGASPTAWAGMGRSVRELTALSTAKVRVVLPAATVAVAGWVAWRGDAAGAGQRDRVALELRRSCEDGVEDGRPGDGVCRDGKGRVAEAVVRDGVEGDLTALGWAAWHRCCSGRGRSDAGAATGETEGQKRGQEGGGGCKRGDGSCGGVSGAVGSACGGCGSGAAGGCTCEAEGSEAGGAL